jgi:hypothetical protein
MSSEVTGSQARAWKARRDLEPIFGNASQHIAQTLGSRSFWRLCLFFAAFSQLPHISVDNFVDSL